MLLALLFACDMPQPPQQAAKPEKPACDADINKLAGTTWVYSKPQPTGPNKPDPSARLRFRDEGGKLLADYTAGSQGSVYNYTCTVAANGIATCLETKPNTEGFCKAYASVHDGVCDPAAIAPIAGVSIEEATKAAEAVNKELKALKPKEKEQQRKVDNSPNNKIRGKFLVAVDKASCQLTLQDKYQTMVDGKLNELENAIGAGKFQKAETEYVWESCEDPDSAWAPDASDNHSAVQAPGTIKFSAMLQKKEKGGPGCTYTADTWVDWVKGPGGIAATDDPKWGPRFDVSIPISEKGRHVVYFDRSKTCDGKTERIGLTCAMVRVE